MELPEYDGGTGGKFRRSLRRPSPYDRPPSATRGLRGKATSAGSGSGWLPGKATSVASGSGWLTKLVDPASRFIAGSTAWIFSSVFRKGLTGLPEAEGSEKNCQVRLHVHETTDVILSESQVQEAANGYNSTKNSENHGISDIEQLLKQKKYTRAQVDYLTGLICSRTAERIGQELESNNEKTHISKEEIGFRNTSLNRNLSASETALNIPQDVPASPAEIAKAYMSSRLQKTSPSTIIGSQYQEFQEDKSLPHSGTSAAKTHDLPAVPQSVSHHSEVHDLSALGYPISKPKGRSAIYRMSRSPYFNVHPSADVKVNDHTSAGNAGSAASLWTPRSTSKSDGKQVLKRSSSYLDSEYGSFGPIRRIRQKSGLVSAANPRFETPSSSHNPPFLQSEKDNMKDPTSSLKIHSSIEYASSSLQIGGNGDGKIFSSDVMPVWGQSSEAGQKKLERLNEIAHSREEKSNVKPIAIYESPSKLTNDMLNGRGLKSMENIDTFQFTSVNDIGTLDFRCVKEQKKFSSSQSENIPLEDENLPLKAVVPAVKNDVNQHAIFSKTSRNSISSADIANTVPAASILQWKPAFQMTAPEDLLELDDEQDTVDVSFKSTANMVKTEPMIAENQTSISIMPAPKQSLLPSSKSMSVSSSTSFSEISKKAFDASQDSVKESSFSFPIATESSGLISPSLAPTMPFQSLDKILSGSRNSNTTIFSAATDSTNESLIEHKPVESLDKKIQLEGSNLFSGGRNEARLHQSSGIVAFSGMPASGSTDAIAISTSITSTQSNGSIHSSSVSSLLSASTPEAISRLPVSSNRKLTAANLNNPAYSTHTNFNFGASLADSSASACIASDKSNSLDTQGKISNRSPFGSVNPSATQFTSSFSSMGTSNTLMGLSPFPGTGSSSTPSVETMTSSSMSMASNSTPVMPYIFSGAASSSSAFAVSPSFSDKTNGISGSSAFSQTNGLSISDADSSSQKSIINFGATGGSMFGVLPVQSGGSNSTFSQGSTSLPGSFSLPATSGLSSSSLSIFGTSSSSSAFGLISSSSPGFEVPFGTANQSAKPFGSTSGFTFSSTSNSNSTFSFSSGSAVSSTSPASLFTSVASVSNLSSGPSSTGSSASKSGFSFAANASASIQGSSTFSPAVTSGLFSGSSLGSSSSMSSSLFGSSPSTGFSFGLTTASGASSFCFGSSSGPVFPFTSSVATVSTATTTHAFALPHTSGGFNSTSQNNDQMNVEDTMADDTNQALVSMVPTFGQPNSTPSPNFVFGSDGRPAFQFGSQQNAPALQNPNSYQAPSNLEFTAGGSFSLGSGGGDKSTRKYVKIRRDKIRRK